MQDKECFLYVSLFLILTYFLWNRECNLKPFKRFNEEYAKGECSNYFLWRVCFIFLCHVSNAIMIDYIDDVYYSLMRPSLDHHNIPVY